MKGWKIGVALFVLLMSVTFFLVEAVACPLLGFVCELQKPAWAMFVVATSFFFKIPLSSLLRLMLRLLDRTEDDRRED
jgi:hypothetical protein